MLHSVSLGKESLIVTEKEAHLNYCPGGGENRVLKESRIHSGKGGGDVKCCYLETTDVSKLLLLIHPCHLNPGKV